MAQALDSARTQAKQELSTGHAPKQDTHSDPAARKPYTSAIVTSTSTPGSMLRRQRAPNHLLCPHHTAFASSLRQAPKALLIRAACKRICTSTSSERPHTTPAQTSEAEGHLIDVICFTTSAGLCRSISLLWMLRGCHVTPVSAPTSSARACQQHAG